MSIKGDGIDVLELLLCGLALEDIQAIHPWVDEAICEDIWETHLARPNQTEGRIRKRYKTPKLGFGDRKIVKGIRRED